MAFSFGRDTHDRAVRSLANLKTFRATRGGSGEGLEGITGPCRRLTGSKYGALPREYARGLDDAQYVVYCYGTPIAWVTMADDATEEGRVNYMPDWQYSATTTYYQGLVRQAWGDKIVDPRPEYSREQNRGTDRGRSSDERYGRVPRRERETRPVSARTSFSNDRSRVNHRGVRYDAQVERDTSYERDMAEARTSDPGPISGAMRADFSFQDQLIDEVRGYSHPAHP